MKRTVAAAIAVAATTAVAFAIPATAADRYYYAGGVREALDLIEEHPEGNGIYLVGVSQGAVVMAETKHPDGGFLSKLDRWNVNIPGYTPVTHTPGQGDT